eukprot:XP_011661264.1 PREDICTED: transmembrane GTPase Marf-like [Strongylocentrotus purpuratus]
MMGLQALSVMENVYGSRPSAMARPEDSRSSTPLRHFVDAKRNMKEIYKEVSDHITDSHAFLCASQLVSDEQLSKVEAFKNQVRGIQDVLERDHMKVAFFGSCNTVNATSRRPQAPSARPAVTPSVLLPVVPKLPRPAVKPSVLLPVVPKLRQLDQLSCRRLTARRPQAPSDRPAVTPSVLLPVVPKLPRPVVTPSSYCPSSPSSVSSTSCNAVSLTARRPQALAARPAVTPSDLLPFVFPQLRQLDQLVTPSVLLPSSPSSVSSTSCDAVSLTARRPQAPSARPAVTQSDLPPVVVPPAPSALPACDAVRPTARRPPSSSVSQLANALAGERDHEDFQQRSILHIFWPKTQCHLLKNDVVLLDSPGIDVEHDMDEWIDDHYMDADVFVLVSNAESTLTRTETSFFLKVSAKLSKPNIFILNNRWDASANEPENMEVVKRQHLEREIKFLVEELKVMTEAQAKDRIFFVSAKEALNSRILQTLSTPNGKVVGVENYERKLEECISQTAVRTTFELRAKQGRQIVDYTREILSQVLEAATKKRNNNYVMDKKSGPFTVSATMTDEIRRLSLLVSATMTDEIRRLSLLVDQFDKPFYPESLMAYKEELLKHVEAGLGQNLAARCSANIKQSVEELQTQMTERTSALTPEASNERPEGLLFCRDFDLNYRFNCQEIFADFKENIEFHFSPHLIPMISSAVAWVIR